MKTKSSHSHLVENLGFRTNFQSATHRKKKFHKFLIPAQYSGIFSFFLIVFLFISFSTQAQIKFEKTYGSATKNEYGRCATALSTGGYAVTGWVNKGAANKDIYFLKLDSCGRKKISRTYGGNKDDQAVAITEVTGSNLAMVGETLSYGSGLIDAYLLKINAPSYTGANGRAIGDTLDDLGTDFQKTSDGGYIVTGYTTRSNATQDVFLAKFNSSLTTQWIRKIGGTNDDQGYSVRQTSDGGYIIAGGTKSYGIGNFDVYLVKTNGAGFVTWAKTYGTTKLDIAYGVKQTLDGGYILVGKTRNANSLGTSMDDILLIKTTSTGTVQWTRAYGGLQDETGENVIQLSDSSYVVVGYTQSFGKGNWDAYLFKVNKSGTTIWARTFGGTAEDKAFSIEKTSDNGFLLCGHTASFGAGGFDAYLMKTNSLGFTGCNDSSLINTYFPPDSVKNGFVEDSTLTVISGASTDTFITVDSIHCSNCSPPRSSLNEIQSDGGFTLYPNPADNFVELVWNTENSEPLTIEVYNSVGILVYRKTGIDPSLQTGFTLYTTDWQQGLYFVRIMTGKQQMNQKLLINK